MYPAPCVSLVWSPHLRLPGYLTNLNKNQKNNLFCVSPVLLSPIVHHSVFNLLYILAWSTLFLPLPSKPLYLLYLLWFVLCELVVQPRRYKPCRLLCVYLSVYVLPAICFPVLTINVCASLGAFQFPSFLGPRLYKISMRYPSLVSCASTNQIISTTFLLYPFNWPYFYANCDFCLLSLPPRPSLFFSSCIFQTILLSVCKMHLSFFSLDLMSFAIQR